MLKHLLSNIKIPDCHVSVLLIGAGTAYAKDDSS